MGSCPLWFFLVLASSVLHDRTIAGNIYGNGQTIGTVLFGKTDCDKQCWSSEDFTVLNSRRMFQDLLPKAKVINYQNDQYIELLMDYFHICLECVRELAIGKTKHLMLKALADTMGGYLRVYILPITRKSYYAGNIKYRNAKKLFELFEELKNFLRTNGVGWMRPVRDLKDINSPPLVITPAKSSTACNGLVTYPASKSNGRKHKRRASKKKKKKRRHVQKSRFSRNPDDDDEPEPSGKSVFVPLPYLDNEAEPNSIALPFKADSLQSLYCEKSAFALVKYYVASAKCISARASSRNELLAFNNDFYKWLQQSVRGHLDDEKWYPAFGGVLRVMTLLEDSGLKGGPVMPHAEMDDTTEAVSPLYEGTGDRKDIAGSDAITFGTTELIVIALVSALLVWLLVGLSLVCYRFLTRHSEECSPCESPDDTPVALLYENADYCHEDTCPSRQNGKSFFHRTKEWWRNKFGPCPGGCQDKYTDEERCLAAINYSSKDVANANDSSKTCQRRKCGKSVSAMHAGSARECVAFRKVYYSSDETTTNSH